MCAHGLRNVLGFDWHPDTGELWGADHGSDWRRDDVPPDELTLLEDSAHYGWPCCWGERRPDWLSSAEPPDGTPKEQFCAERTKGMTLGFAARSAGIDSLFYDGEQFPEESSGATRSSRRAAPATGRFRSATRSCACASRTGGRARFRTSLACS